MAAGRLERPSWGPACRIEGSGRALDPFANQTSSGQRRDARVRADLQRGPGNASRQRVTVRTEAEQEMVHPGMREDREDSDPPGRLHWERAAYRDMRSTKTVRALRNTGIEPAREPRARL